MSDEPLIYHYNPRPIEEHEPLLAEGATPAYLVCWSGEPGAAMVANITAITDPEGHGIIDVDPDSWQSAQVVDDTDQGDT